MLGMDHQSNNNFPRINFDRSKIRLWLMLPRNPDCALNLTCEMNRIFMKTPTCRASPAGSGDHVFQSVRSFANAARRTGGTLIDCNIRLVSPLPTGATHGRRVESLRNGQAQAAAGWSLPCARCAAWRELNFPPNRARSPRALPRPVTFNSLIGLALPAASMGTSSLRTCPAPGSSRINRTALSPATVALNGHGGSRAEPASVAGAVFAFTRSRVRRL